MSRAFWDNQLQFSRIIPEFAALLERAAADSAAWSADRDFHRLAYGQDPRQWVELTAGTGSGDLLPVVIHGGYWRALEAVNHRFLMAPLLDLGAEVANVEYRLMPEVRLDDVVGDVRAALTVLIDRFPDRNLLLIGHSAGAHLALRALADPIFAARTQGVLALSGIFDLRPIPQSFLQDELSLTSDEITHHSLHPAKDRPPVVYVNGTDETFEYLRGGALMASEGRATQHLLPDANHMSLLWAAAAEVPELIQILNALE